MISTLTESAEQGESLGEQHARSLAQPLIVVDRWTQSRSSRASAPKLPCTKNDSPTRHPFPFDRHDGSASNTTAPTSDAILEVEHPLARLQPKPNQESRYQQRRV